MPKSNNPTHYTTGDIAARFNMTTKTVRRHMRRIDVRCGSGARHAFNKRDFDRIVKRLQTERGLTPFTENNVPSDADTD